MSKKNLLKCLLSIPEDEYSPRYHFFLYSNRNPLVTSFNVLLDNGRIPVALTNELSCSADCSQGIWI